jgi:hypothetical protein
MKVRASGQPEPGLLPLPEAGRSHALGDRRQRARDGPRDRRWAGIRPAAAAVRRAVTTPGKDLPGARVAANRHAAGHGGQAPVDRQRPSLQECGVEEAASRVRGAVEAAWRGAAGGSVSVCATARKSSPIP